MKNFSIGIIEPIGGHGGIDIYDKSLVLSIKSQGIDNIKLYTSKNSDNCMTEFVKPFYKNIYSEKNKYIRALLYIKGSLMVYLDIKKNKTSIIHLNIFNFSLLEYINVLIIKKILLLKVVAVIHDVESLKIYESEKKNICQYDNFISLFDGVILHTEYAKNELLKKLSNDVCGKINIKVIYEPCDIDEFEKFKCNKDTARKKIALPLEKKIILFFGQIKKNKGLDILIDAFSEVYNNDKSVLLVIAGKIKNGDFSEYDKIIEKNKLQECVEKRIHYISNEDMPNYFLSADVVVLPYRKIYNSGVLIRAMAFGTPVLASNIGPFSEFIIDDVNGVLFNLDDKNSLFEKMSYMLNSEELLSGISRNSVIKVKHNMSIEHIGNKFISFYSEVLK